MASLCPQWRQGEPLPPTMAPFNLPQECLPQVEQPVLGEHWTQKEVLPGSVHTLLPFKGRGTKATPLYFGQGREAELRHPHQTIPPKPQPFSGAG